MSKKPPTTVITGSIIAGSESVIFKGSTSRDPEFHSMTIGGRKYKIPAGKEINLQVQDGVPVLDGVELEPEPEEEE